jgi:arylsulfatase A-like enzyme
MLARCPELFSGGRVVEQMVANLDIMPTILAVAGVEPPVGLDGMNWLPLVQGQSTYSVDPNTVVILDAYLQEFLDARHEHLNVVWVA